MLSARMAKLEQGQTSLAQKELLLQLVADSKKAQGLPNGGALAASAAPASGQKRSHDGAANGNDTGHGKGKKQKKRGGKGVASSSGGDKGKYAFRPGVRGLMSTDCAITAACLDIPHLHMGRRRMECLLHPCRQPSRPGRQQKCSSTAVKWTCS